MSAILQARNKHKKQHKVYLQEAVINMAELLSEKYLGKKSASLFIWASTVLIENKLGCNHDFLNKKDRLILNDLYRAFSSLM
jgi:hypothetical protein